MLGWRRTRRLTLLLLLIGVAGALWQRRALSAAPAPEPSWPPFEPTSSPVQGFAASAAEPDAAPAADEPDAAPAADEPESSPEPESTPEPAATWVAPVDGACPDGYPVKANDNSRIFHVPGGRFYDRTIPERCYATTDDALADGYRRAKA